jgi:hypothetical protein
MISNPHKLPSSHRAGGRETTGRKKEDVPITKTPHKRLAPILRPILFVIKHTRIPDNLVEQLTHAHGVSSRAGPAGFKGAEFGVGHMCHVVWGVEVDAVPATTERQRHGLNGYPWKGGRREGRGDERREANSSHNTRFARCGRKIEGLRVTVVDAV